MLTDKEIEEIDGDLRIHINRALARDIANLAEDASILASLSEGLPVADALQALLKPLADALAVVQAQVDADLPVTVHGILVKWSTGRISDQVARRLMELDDDENLARSRCKTVSIRLERFNTSAPCPYLVGTLHTGCRQRACTLS